MAFVKKKDTDHGITDEALLNKLFHRLVNIVFQDRLGRKTTHKEGGCVVISADDVTVKLDCYIGKGDLYRAREEVFITIVTEGKERSYTVKEFQEQLNK